jgi:acyl-ACP thioesterase
MSKEPINQKSWEDEYSISFYEVDTKNEVFLPVLWSFMQETAWHHADHLGVGYSHLMEHQYFWVLSRLSIQMEEYPRWGDQIKVKTWLTGTGRLFALRQFSISTPKGNDRGGKERLVGPGPKEPQTSEDRTRVQTYRTSLRWSSSA